jgi:hypothetical protein
MLLRGGDELIWSENKSQELSCCVLKKRKKHINHCCEQHYIGKKGTT